VRLAILISLGVLGLGATGVRDDDAPVKCEVGTHGGYLIPVGYAEAHRADIVSTLPDGPEVDGFWKVSEQIAIVSDRNLRETIEDAIKDPTLLFPDLTPGGDATVPDSLEYQRNELRLVLEHYGAYERQYVGVVIEGREFVVCNYALGPDLDPAAGYLFIHKIFQPGSRLHFLQCRFDWDYRKISNVAFVGPWQGKEDR
jgi:hypothetical protein